MSWPIGRADSHGFGSDHLEQLRWAGKPWRRVELQTDRFYYRGEQVEVSRHLSLHLGLRRLGVAVTVGITRQSCLDYSGDEL